MDSIKVRNLDIGAGIPKICVPIVGTDRTAILDAAKRIPGSAADLAEWRADWYEDIFDEQKTGEMLKELRMILGDMPILFTFRTAGEGGEKKILDRGLDFLDPKIPPISTERSVMYAISMSN